MAVVVGCPGSPRERVPLPRPRKSVRRERRVAAAADLSAKFGLPGGRRRRGAARRAAAEEPPSEAGRGCPASPVPPRLPAGAKSARTARLGRARGEMRTAALPGEPAVSVAGGII